MNENDAGRLLATLAAAWPEKEMPAATARLYLDALVPYDLETGQRSVQRIIRTMEWFPRISTLIEYLDAASPRTFSHALPASSEPVSVEEGLAAARAALQRGPRAVGS